VSPDLREKYTGLTQRALTYSGLCMFQITLANILTSPHGEGGLRALSEHPRRVREESGIGWIPMCSTAWTSSTRTSTRTFPLKLKPSEYWRRQCKATFQYDRVGTKLIDEMGLETLMWGSDYPHPTACGRTEKYISEQFKHLPDDVVRKMTCEERGRFYGLIK